MSTFKSLVRRGTLLGATGALVLAAIAPTGAVFAQSALNPLTQRSLLLSSSAPGYVDTDGSGYSTTNPNPSGNGVLGAPGVTVPNTYAPAGSGPNGKRTGETFKFNVSTASASGALKGFSLQYCTSAAGLCKGPGNNTGDARGTWDSGTSTWDGTSTRESNATAHASNARSDLDVSAAFTQAGFGAGGGVDPAAGEFQVYVGGTATTVDDWTMEIKTIEDQTWVNPGSDSENTQTGLTGKKNFIALHSATGISTLAGQEVKIVFKASESNYITNPGKGEFFVKINSYNTDNHATGFVNTTNANIIDGGVTVANVMTDSIHIVTKVLETMAFSVGIENPDTVDRNGGTAVVHGKCEPISQTSSITGLTNNRLNLGDANAEYSLRTDRAYDVYSYWRLSSNSSGGATVYYSGDTLTNTSGDRIAPMDSLVDPEGTLSNPGSEQFGLGFVDAGSDNFTLANDTFAPGWVTPRSYPFITVSGQVGSPAQSDAAAPYNTLAAQSGSAGYRNAAGRINPENNGADPVQAKFRFFRESLTTPSVIAQQSETVISCATAKMRYVANIGADTPAGVYTTKINYLAAPQY